MSRRVGGSVAVSPIGSPRKLSNLIELDKSGISDNEPATRKTERPTRSKLLPYNDRDDEKPKRTTSLSRSLFGGLMNSTTDKANIKRKRRDSVNSK